MDNSVYLIPGMKLRLSLFTDLAEGSAGIGAHAKQGNAYTMRGKQYAMVKGFVVEDSQVGTLEAVGEDSVEVYYTHKKPEKNTIYFITADSTVVTLSIITTSIHDHSNIVQGGPAYGTFFDDDESI